MKINVHAPIPPYRPPYQLKGIVPLSLQEAAQITGGTIGFEQGHPVIDKLSGKPATKGPTESSRQQHYFKRYTEKDEWSDSVQAVLEVPPAKLSQYLILLGLAFSGVFVAWACLGSMQEVSRAQGELIPQGKTYKIEPVIEGQIDSILVKEGDRIRKNQTLLSLDSDLLETEVTRLEQALISAEKELSQRQLLITKTQQEGQANSQIAAANIEVQKASLQQAQELIDTSQSLRQSLESEMAARQERLNRISGLEDQGAISKEYLFDIEQGVREQAQSIMQNQGQQAQALAKMQEAEAEVAQKQAEEQQIAISAQQDLQRLTIEEQQLESTIADLNTQLSQAKTKLSQSYVKASTSGTLSNLTIDNIGEFVQPGQVLAEVVPENAPLILSTIVPHSEAGLLKAGMAAQIKMQAFPYQDYGILTGKVISISPAAKAPSQITSQTTSSVSSGYKVNISLDQDFVIHERQKVYLQVGQTADADIIVRRRRIIQVLLDPIRQLTESEFNL